MAKKKRPSWVGGANPVDTETNLQRPLVQMTSGQRAEALKDSESAEAVKPRKSSTSRGKIGPRIKGPVATRQKLKEAGLREPKRGELKRGITAVTVKPKRQRKRNVPLVQRNPETGKAEKRTFTSTGLPVAGPEQMSQPSPGPRVPLEMPRGGVKEAMWKDEKGVSRRLKGFGAPVEHVSKKAWEAMGHLDSIRMHQSGSPEHSKHYINFQNAHEELRPMSSDVYGIVAMAHKVATAPKYGGQDTHLNLIKDALSERISIGRAMEKRRSAASTAGNPKKAGQQ